MRRRQTYRQLSLALATPQYQEKYRPSVVSHNCRSLTDIVLRFAIREGKSLERSCACSKTTQDGTAGDSQIELGCYPSCKHSAASSHENHINRNHNACACYRGMKSQRKEMQVQSKQTNNQLINQSTNQPINQSTNQPINKLIKSSSNRTTTIHKSNQSMNQ